MLESIAMIIVAALAVAGAVWLIEGLIVRFSSCADENLYIVIAADESSNNIDIRLLEAHLHLNRMSGKTNKEIIVIDNGISEEARKIINLKRTELGDIRILKPCELQNLK